MKLVITASGGGHFAPALAVIKSLPKEVDVLFVGRKYALEADGTISFEYQIASKLGIKLETITTGRLQRHFTRYTFISLFKTPYGLIQAFLILQKFKPDVVLSFGGYVTLPVVITAYLLKIPIVLHEQTLESGITNKIASYFAKKICVTWESSMEHFPKEKTVFTGNPIRKFSREAGSSFARQISDENLPLVYITGGSLGSHAINLLIEGCLEKLLSSFRVVHQAGDAQEFKDYDRLLGLKRTFSKEFQDRYYLTKFVDPNDVSTILQEADLVISRAGAGTITELLYLGKVSLLIPLSYAQRNEQYKLAKIVKDIGLGEILEQKSATPEVFYENIREMIHKKDDYLKNAEKAKKLIKTDAEKEIVKVIESVVSSEKRY